MARRPYGLHEFEARCRRNAGAAIISPGDTEQVPQAHRRRQREPMVTTDSRVPAAALPVGTVTFLATDIESATMLWESEPDAMASAVARHREILDGAIAAHGGKLSVDHSGQESGIAFFPRASDAVASALAAQLALQAETWPTTERLRVRMALHTGEAGPDDRNGGAGLTVIRTARLRALAHGEQVLVSSASRDLTLDHLAESVELVDLGEQRLKDLARSERVYQLSHPRLRSDFPRPRPLDATPNNLPVRLSTFIGRHDELAILDDLLRGHRCVTITGSGGAGKTRLALQSAAEHADTARDGVWWLELAPLADPSAVAVALAVAIGAHLDESRTPTDAVVARLGSRAALLVLDNCEHLVEACARVAETVLQQCPNVRLIATSRVPLGMPGEMTWRVPPLAVPSPTQAATRTGIERFDAVRLFVERARHAKSTFRMTETNGPVVAEICQRLDGIPLAIELAAARTRSLSPSKILAGLSDSLRILTGGSLLVLPRHQTLDASIRWSSALLDERARRLLIRLSMFRGTFDLVGAESVCIDDGLAVTEILDSLERLIDHSLIVALDGEQEGRFQILETVRQFGERQLEAEGTRTRWAANHAKYYAQLAQEVGPQCETGRQFHAVRMIEAERDNIRAALAWHRDSANVSAFAEMVCDLAPFWDVGGDRLEGTTWATRALELLPIDPNVLRARLSAYRGEWRLTMGSFRGALDDCSVAMSMGESLGDAKAAGRGSSTLTTVLAYADLERWRPRWEKTVELLTEAGDMFALAGTLTWGAVPLIRRGHTNDGIAALDRARPYVLATGQPLLKASQLLWEGFAANQAGDPARAEELASAALASNALGAPPRVEGAEIVVAIARGLRGLPRRTSREYMERADRARRDGENLTIDSASVMAALELLREQPDEARKMIDRWLAERADVVPMVKCEGTVIGAQAAFHVGDFDDAWQRSEALLEQATACQHVLFQAKALVLRGAILLTRNETTRAEEMVRRGITLHADHGNRVWLCEGIEVLAAITIACGDVVEGARLLGSAGAARSAMDVRLGLPFRGIVTAAEATARVALGDAEFERAVNAGALLSLDETLAFVQRSRGARGRPARGWDSLSPAERQAAGLVCDGLSNREIAERLLMSSETVKTHLAHIFTKLDINKRAQLAALVANRRH